MSILARKTTLSKWQRAYDICKNNIDHLPADVITSDLRTFGNTLSTWKVDCDENHKMLLDDVIIALLTGPKVERIETIDLIFIDTDRYNQFEYQNTDGCTLVESLKEKHYDVCNLNFKSLGEFCVVYLDAIKECSKENIRFIKFSKRQVTAILKDAIKNRRVSLENFSEKMQENVKELMEEAC